MAEPVAPDPESSSSTAWRRIRPPRTKLLNRISIQSKLLLMLVLCTMLAAIVVGGIAFNTGRNSLRTASFVRLTEIREAQKRMMTTQLNDLKSALVTYTNGDTTVSALRDFTAAFDQLSNATITPEMQKGIVDYYDFFAKETYKDSGTRLDPAALLPTSNAERYLQATYTAKLPTDDLAIAMYDEHDGSAWSAANAKYHRFFAEIVTRFAFEDALLINNKGDVVYSTYKNTDLGTNILNGPYNGSKLRDAYVQAMTSNKEDRVTFTDFEFYEPTNLSPTAWMVAPIPATGKADGVMALQFPITKINRIMTFDKHWSDVGMGETGETILAGPDYLMRSDSRMFLENPEEYKRRVIDAGTPPDIPDIAIRQGGTTLIQPVTTEASKEAQKGLSGTLVTKDYLGDETLQSYAPVGGMAGLQWSILAKVTTKEAFAREATFTRTVVLATTGIIFLVCLLAALLAQVFLRPIRRLEAGVQRIGSGDFNVEIPVETRDEIGELTGMFNEMSRSLSVKEDMLTEQRGQIKSLLRSLMPGAIADKVFQGEEVAARDHANVTVVYVDITGLDRIQTELESGEYLELIGELIRQFDAVAAEYNVERVHPVRNGFLGSCGLTTPRLDNVRQTVDFAVECMRIIERFNGESGLRLGLRAGIDTGTVSSGLVGDASPIFDMWGTAVTLASRIKNGAPEEGIYVTSRVHDVLADTATLTSAGTVELNGKSEPIWRLEDSQ